MEVSGKSHRGRLRPNNEDAIYIHNERISCLPNLFIIADGMGGHNSGDVASNLAISSFIEYVSQFSSNQLLGEHIEIFFNNAFQYANDEIYTLSHEHVKYQGMGTTLLACTVIDDMLYAANIGDSRLYIIDRNDIRKISIDHSLVEEMVLNGEITEEEAMHHPKKNILTQAVGIEMKVRPDTYHVHLSEDSYILLCTDGLTNMVNPIEIQRTILNYPIHQAAEQLVHAANENGGSDNISLVLLHFMKGSR